MDKKKLPFLIKHNSKTKTANSIKDFIVYCIKILNQTSILGMLQICIKWPTTLIPIQNLSLVIIAYFMDVTKISVRFFRKFTKTADISYNMENFNLKQKFRTCMITTNWNSFDITTGCTVQTFIQIEEKHDLNINCKARQKIILILSRTYNFSKTLQDFRGPR